MSCPQARQAGDVRITLATSFKDNEREAYKRMAQMGGLVHEWALSDDAEQCGPHPDLFATTLKRSGTLATQEVITAGTALFDAQGAGKAGLRTMGFL